MLIAQITDLHLGFEGNDPAELNGRRLDMTLAHLRSLDPRPDLLLLTGDLVHNEDDDVAYRRLKSALQDFPCPVYFAMGNHDDRAAFLRVFPEAPQASGFVQYAIEEHPVRILVLDTLEVGRHGGGFCERRAEWLHDRLSEMPDRPTFLALHHPPLATGLSWMTENPNAHWVERLRGIVSAHDNIVGMTTGHLHRPVATLWACKQLIVCPSTSPQVALDLGTIDPERPDGRPMIVAAPPGYALHYWNGTEMVTHFGFVQEDLVLARYDAAFQPVVRQIAEEDAGR
ncbi:metallophosphoesterase [Sphingomonas humi]|uniref:Phosphodiesterase n=1 Tax=Sphingomonas humi TaxID=335630 RepID=A0ABP7SEY1_9SPHN